MPTGKAKLTKDERLKAQEAECRKRQATRNERFLINMVRKRGGHLKYENKTGEYTGIFDIQQMIIFGLSLLGVSTAEIAERTGESIHRISKLTSMYKEHFYGDMAVQAAVRGAQAKLLELLEPAIESIKYHVTNFNDSKNYDAAKDILTNIGVFSAQKEGSQTVNIAIINEERKKNLSHSLQTFGYEVIDVPGNGGKPDGSQTRSRMPESDQS